MQIFGEDASLIESLGGLSKRKLGRGQSEALITARPFMMPCFRPSLREHMVTERALLRLLR